MPKRDATSEFWQDFDAEMEDPEFRVEFLRQHARTLTVDRIVNALEERREGLGVSKAELARHLQDSPPAVRRLSARSSRDALAKTADSTPVTCSASQTYSARARYAARQMLSVPASVKLLRNLDFSISASDLLRWQRARRYSKPQPSDP